MGEAAVNNPEISGPNAETSDDEKPDDEEPQKLAGATNQQISHALGSSSRQENGRRRNSFFMWTSFETGDPLLETHRLR